MSSRLAATGKSGPTRTNTRAGGALRRRASGTAALSPAITAQRLQRRVGNRATQHLLQAVANPTSAQLRGDVNEAGSGTGLPGPLRLGLEQLSGMDLSGVRVHKNSAKPAQLNALAYAQGQNIHVAPGQEKHLPHEGWHAVQQMQGRVQPTMQTKGVSINDDLGLEREADVMGAQALQRTRRSVFAQGPAAVVPQTEPTTTMQRRVNPEDVASELVGQPFRVAGAFSAGGVRLNAGDTVTVITWSNTSDTVTVAAPAPAVGPPAAIDVPKTLLRPIAPTAAGIATYSADVGGQARAVEREEQRIQAELTRPGGPRPGEITRLQGLQRTRRRLLNRRLIQESMFNRFDPSIRRWTDHYNARFGFTGPDALDANLVKSMIFQESQMGTSGGHLEVAPTWAVRSRFNIGQVIDSGAAALLVMMRELEPALITRYHLQNIDRDRVRAQQDLRRLSALASRTPSQTARLNALRAIDQMSLSFAEDFMWEYTAPGETDGFGAAVEDFFDVGAGSRRSLDYDFWIRTTIRWLFEKRQSVSSWPEAIRAYNGSGVAARHYRDAVRDRAGQASRARSAGRSFVPGRI